MQYNCVVTGQVIGRIRTQRAGLSGVARSHLALLEAGIKNVGVDTRASLESKSVISMPIEKLATLGAAASSLIPALRTVTQTTTLTADGLYRLANADVGALKIAKNGNFWGAIRTADGSSKLAQLQAASGVTGTSTAVMPIDPATMMMAVALFSIEQKLGSIIEMEKQILSFLEIR